MLSNRGKRELLYWALLGFLGQGMCLDRKSPCGLVLDF